MKRERCVVFVYYRFSWLRRRAVDNNLDPAYFAGTAVKFVVGGGSKHQFFRKDLRWDMGIGPFALDQPMAPFDALAYSIGCLSEGFLVTNDVYASAVMVGLQDVALGQGVKIDLADATCPLIDLEKAIPANSVRDVLAST